MKIKLLLFSLLTASCMEPTQYKHVIAIKNSVETYTVKITTEDGGNTIQRAAGGALIGGLILGKKGMIAGGLIGAATTDEPTVQTHTETRTKVTYVVSYDDSTVEVFVNYCPYTIGSKVPINH